MARLKVRHCTSHDEQNPSVRRVLVHPTMVTYSRQHFQSSVVTHCTFRTWCLMPHTVGERSLPSLLAWKKRIYRSVVRATPFGGKLDALLLQSFPPRIPRTSRVADFRITSETRPLRRWIVVLGSVGTIRQLTDVVYITAKSSQMHL